MEALTNSEVSRLNGEIRRKKLKERKAVRAKAQKFKSAFHGIPYRVAIIMKKAFRLVGLDCANCAAKIERDVQKLSGVEKASVSLMTTRMVIEAPEDKMDEITVKATEIVNKYEPDVQVKRG